MLTINNISYKKADKVVFENLGITLGDCSCLVIRDCNDIEASALINILLCKTKPSKGNILYYNKAIKGRFLKEYLSITNYIDKKSVLHDDMTVSENLIFLSSFSNDESSVEASINFFGLDFISDVLVKDLSDSLRKKVSLARLLACPRKIWFLNNPFVGLSEKDKLLLMSTIDTRCSHGGIVVLICDEKLAMSNYIEMKINNFYQPIVSFF